MWGFNIFLLTFFLNWEMISVAGKYCCLDCGNKTHIMCMKSFNPVDGCKLQQWTVLNITRRRRNAYGRRQYTLFILGDMINNEREKLAVSQGISNMELVEWSNELEEFAVAAAEMCTDPNDICTHTNNYRVKSLKHNSTSVQEMRNAVGHWMFGPNNDASDLLKTSTISRMACAGADHNATTGNTSQILCLFGPIGGPVGRDSWKNGKPCSACPGTSRCLKGQNICSETNLRIWTRDATLNSGCPLDEVTQKTELDPYTSDWITVITRKNTCDVISSARTVYADTKLIVLVVLLRFTFFGLTHCDLMKFRWSKWTFSAEGR